MYSTASVLLQAQRFSFCRWVGEVLQFQMNSKEFLRKKIRRRQSKINWIRSSELYRQESKLIALSIHIRLTDRQTGIYIHRFARPKEVVIGLSRTRQPLDGQSSLTSLWISIIMFCPLTLDDLINKPLIRPIHWLLACPLGGACQQTDAVMTTATAGSVQYS